MRAVTSPIPERPKLPPARRPQVWDAEGVTWTVEHDVPGRETRARVGYGSRSQADEVAPDITDRVDGEVGVSLDDPGRAWVESTSTTTVNWPEVSVSATARTRIESDAEAYHLTLDVETTEDGRVRWSRRFEHRYPRALQ